MNFYDFDVRIAYADTDRMGVVYYANYLVLFERGRTEFLRSLGLRYRDLEEVRKLFMPAMESHINYYRPARYDDMIRVRTFIAELGKAHIVFGSEIFDENGKVIADGHVKLAVVNGSWKPTRMPQDLYQRLSPHISSSNLS